jgi:protein-tyrosine phosphatase
VAGRLWLCGKHHIGPDVHRVRAHTDNATVVCLVQRHELTDRYDSYVQWLETNHNGDAIWYPVHDLGAPGVEHAAELFVEIRDRLRNGENFVVHCAAGIGRAGTTAVGVLMVLGMPAEEAVAHVRAHRPMAGPEAGAQNDLIRDLESKIARGEIV